MNLLYKAGLDPASAYEHCSDKNILAASRRPEYRSCIAFYAKCRVAIEDAIHMYCSDERMLRAIASGKSPTCLLKIKKVELD